MNELININVDTLNQTVSARELYKKLEIEKRFSAWFETNSQGFVEGEDFTSVLSGTVVNNGAYRELEDYACSIDMAKHICLMSRTEKGKQCRQYLIELEKAWNTPEQVMARALRLADETIKKLTVDIERMKPKEIFSDAIMASDTTILVREVAKILKQNGIQTGEKRLYKWLVNNHYLIKKGDDYEPTQRSMELRLFEITERPIEMRGETHIRRTVRVTPQGQKYFINKFLKRKDGELCLI